MTGLLGIEDDAFCPAPEKPVAPQCRTTDKAPTPPGPTTPDRNKPEPACHNGRDQQPSYATPAATPQGRQQLNSKTNPDCLKVTPQTQTRQAENGGQKTNRQPHSKNKPDNLPKTQPNKPPAMRRTTKDATLPDKKPTTAPASPSHNFHNPRNTYGEDSANNPQNSEMTLNPTRSETKQSQPTA
ncbi:MAG: hypothetical protein PHE96_09155 [Methylococcales bacterium]|nr:hypothetical protein [Methylococcales bacterium]